MSKADRVHVDLIRLLIAGLSLFFFFANRSWLQFGEKNDAIVIGVLLPSGTPVNRIPIMAKQVLDLYKLYKLVTEKGGLVEVINKKIWREITRGLNLPTSITSAAFTLRTQYVSETMTADNVKVYYYPITVSKPSGWYTCS